MDRVLEITEKSDIQRTKYLYMHEVLRTKRRSVVKAYRCYDQKALLGYRSPMLGVIHFQ